MVYLFLADGFEEIEALCVLDLLRRAKVDVKTVGVTGKIACGSHNIPVTCDVVENELDINEDFDMIILPGGLPGADNLNDSRVVDLFIKEAVKKDKFICAICAAPYILGIRGILKGKNATCYPGFENKLEGVIHCDQGVVRDGKIITGRAMGSATDFALEIIEALLGKDIREKIRASIIYN
jgi:4-methyl-5(b-hydroxyethyl)-thiazole monophosphate biosynthesis